MSVEVEKDEMDQDQFDPFLVKNKQEGFVYRFLNKNSRNIAQKLRQGYQIVQDNDPEQLILTESTPLKAGEQIDTTKRFNDVILARIPLEKYKVLQKKNREAIARRQASITQTFRSQTGAAGFVDTKGGGGYSGRMTEGQFNETAKK